MKLKLKALLAVLLIIGLLLIPLPYPQTVEAQGWLDGWAKRVEFTIDHNDIDENVTWFPVRLHLSATSGEATEEQTEVNHSLALYSGATVRAGQKLTISNRTVTTLSFKISRDDFPPGNVTFTIRQLDNTVLASKVWGLAYTLTTTPTWRTVTFDTPVLINEEVRLLCEYSGGDAGDLVSIRLEDADVKASEEFTYYVSSWANYTPWDCAYRYTYSQEDVSCVFDEVGANSLKIAITKADGSTELYGEIEKWDNGNELADIHTSRDGWVISNSTNTTGYLYYDNTHADNDAYIGIKNSTPAQSVWRTAFQGVWHMTDGADTSNIYDSTSNNNDGAKKGANEPIVSTSGNIANAQEFDGVNDYIGVTDADGLSTHTNRTMTFSGWFYPTKIGFQCIFDKEDAYALLYDRGGDQKLNFATYGANKYFGPAEGFAVDTWHRFALVWNQTADTLDAWVSGTQYLTGESYTDASTNTTSSLEFGAQETSGSFHYFEGMLDEMRISNVDNGNDWEQASYESERDHLITWGIEETAPVGEITYGYIIG